ncbi:MAG: hypothetical protein ACK4S4_00835 [Pyrinomonadaceae bacterium]
MRGKLIGAAAGFVYSVVYSFLALMATGGGHGNFIWLFLYFIPVLGPLVYFPVMGWLAADLRSIISRSVYIALLIGEYLVLASLTIFAKGDVAADNAKTWERNPEVMYFMGAVYLAGQVPLVLLLIRSFLQDRWERARVEMDYSKYR